MLRLSVGHNVRGRVEWDSIELAEVTAGANAFIDAEEAESKRIEVENPDGTSVQVTKEKLMAVLKQVNDRGLTAFRQLDNGSFMATVTDNRSARMSEEQAKALAALS